MRRRGLIGIFGRMTLKATKTSRESISVRESIRKNASDLEKRADRLPRVYFKTTVLVLFLLVCITIPADASGIKDSDTPAQDGYHADIERMLKRAGIATAFILVVSDDQILSAEGYGNTKPADILGITKEKMYEIATEKTLIDNRLSLYLPSRSLLSCIPALIAEEASCGEMTESSLPGIRNTIEEFTRKMPDASLTKKREEISRGFRVSRPTSFSFRGYTVLDQSYTLPGVRILVTSVPDTDSTILIMVSESNSPIPEAIRARILDTLI
ncbi:MAG: hypothetical protein JXA44_14045 [Methanospirillaceae archaeon]|nr:hypothetical protein [Methanospirillaceae archaeon]